MAIVDDCAATATEVRSAQGCAAAPACYCSQPPFALSLDRGTAWATVAGDMLYQRLVFWVPGYRILTGLVRCIGGLGNVGLPAA